MRLRIPLRDQSLREPHRDIHRVFVVAVKINHRSLHPLQGDEQAFGLVIQRARRSASQAGLVPIVNKPGKLSRLQRIPRKQNAVGALHRCERAPFMRDIVFDRVVSRKDAQWRDRQNQRKEGCFHGL